MSGGGENGASDAELWLRATSGDERTFVCLFDRYRRRILAAAWRRTESADLAEEALAVVFLELWRLRARVRIVDGSLLPWMLVVTANVCRNLLRSRHRYRRLLNTLPSPEHVADTLDAVEHDDQRARTIASVRAALRGLNERDNVIVTLCLLEERSAAEAAQVLGLPIGTVKSRLSRAKARLRVTLETGADDRRDEIHA